MYSIRFQVLKELSDNEQSPYYATVWQPRTTSSSQVRLSICLEFLVLRDLRVVLQARVLQFHHAASTCSSDPSS